ncbi:MAG: diacylglycerol/polyprenol kinase family protein [Sphaerochaetaceae bacterium]
MNITGLAVSFAFIGIVVAIGFLMAYSKKFSPEVVRKFIHIAVSNWWILLLIFFDSLQTAVVGPVVFIFINAAAVYSKFADKLGVRDWKRNLGLVYFPVSLLIIVILTYTEMIPFWAGTIGVFAMGYGDGLAALIGYSCGKRKIMHDKSLVGSAVMFIVTAVLILIVGFVYGLAGSSFFSFLLFTIVISVFLTLIELFTPWGLDNITVPIGGALLSAFLLGAL